MSVVCIFVVSIVFTGKDFAKKPFSGGGSRVTTPDIGSDFIEKENQRDYSTKIIDKQKANRVFDEKKKATRAHKGMDEEGFNEGKLRNLKQVNKLSNMFEDQDGGMLDYYDMSS